MFKNCSTIRVRYSETDRMGFVYYGNYAQYYETGRVEALRSLGLSYREMEDAGIILPVIHFEINYFKPAYYDDVLSIETIIPLMPDAKIRFDYTCFNQKEEVLNKGTTTLVFVNKQSNKPCRPPQQLSEYLKPYFR